MKDQITRANSPYDMAGTAVLTWRYRDPKAEDNSFAYVPAIRRVRRMTPANRSDAMMGSDMAAIVLGLYGAIGIAMVLLVTSRNKHSLLILSVISTAYSLVIGAIYFQFLPLMKKMAESYEPVERDTIFTGPGGFDPSTVDFVF